VFRDLFYSGPGLDVLKEQYAKRGRLDREAPIVTARETLVDAPVAQVWKLISDPAGWPAFDPAVSDVHVEGPVSPDVEFTRRVGRTRIRAVFAVVEPEREITWVGRASGSKVVHRNLLRQAPGGGTTVVSEESMAGFLLTLFYDTAKLDRVLDGWLGGLKAASERAVA
jgi:carbon monoxide dehydrogenase subunit G